MLVSVSSGGRAAVFTFVITHGLTVDQFRQLSPHLSAAGVKGQLRLQAWWLMQKLQVDIRAKEVKKQTGEDECVCVGGGLFGCKRWKRLVFHSAHVQLYLICLPLRN